MVKSVAFSPDGQGIVGGSHDKKLKIWDANSGDELQTLTPPTSNVTSVAFSPDGQLLVFHTEGAGRVKIWDASE